MPFKSLNQNGELSQINFFYKKHDSPNRYFVRISIVTYVVYIIYKDFLN